MTTYASQSLTRVTQQLYRTDAGQYFGKIKRNGKIHKKSLETTDFQTAKRSLKEFEKEVESRAAGSPDMLFQDFVSSGWSPTSRPSSRGRTSAVPSPSLSRT